MNADPIGPAGLRVAVAMLGARRHYAVPRVLHSAGLLECFLTDFHSDTGLLNFVRLVLRDPIRPDGLARLLERETPDIPGSRIRSFPCFGLWRALRQRSAATPGQRLRDYAQWNRRFCELVRDRWPEGANAAYVFNSAGLEVLQHAATRRAKAVLDQTAAPWAVDEPLLAREREVWTGWEHEGTAREDWEPLAERERGEWALADRIICGSDYVVESVGRVGGPVGKCVVVPYGVSPAQFQTAPAKAGAGPLRVLYAGTVQLRKGIQYLLEAARRIKPGRVVIRAVGPVRVSNSAARQLQPLIELAGAVSRASMQREYDAADVLVLPSLSEGSANVCYEALACGLPVVTTPNAGSPVRDGQEGFVVPVRSPEALADRIETLAADRRLVGELSRRAAERAREFTWERYRDRLLSALAPLRE